MTCTQQFYKFFEKQATTVPGIKSVSKSGGDKMDRLLANSRNMDIYPACFLLRPKYSTEGNGAGATIGWFDANFYVICQGEMGDEEQEDVAFDLAEQLATEITTAIRNQADGYQVLNEPEQRVYMEPITMVTLEASYGYEVRFKIGLMVNQAVYGERSLTN